jgi:hypothetical protein
MVVAVAGFRGDVAVAGFRCNAEEAGVRGDVDVAGTKNSDGGAMYSGGGHAMAMSSNE